MSDTSMNRQARRMAKKQGLTDDDGAPVRERRSPQNQQSRPKEERTPPGQFLKEVRAELRKVSWPTREEVINYSLIVLTLVTLLTVAIGFLDYGIGEAVLALFGR